MQTHDGDYTLHSITSTPSFSHIQSPTCSYYIRSLRSAFESERVKEKGRKIHPNTSKYSANMAHRDDDNDGREGSTKRARLMAPETDPQQYRGHHAIATKQCSVQAFLSVPLHIVFRRQDGGGGRRRHKPLMTRAEAHTLLTVTELARELDVLVDLSSQALERQVQSQMIRSDIQDIPTFRSLVPALVVHGHHIPQQALAHLESEVNRVLASFQACALTLKQFSEQNWTMSDSLLDAFGPDDMRGHALAKEKRGLSDLEEELSKRLEHLSSVAEVSSKEAMFGDYEQDELSMATLANRMFSIKEAPLTAVATSSKKRTAAAASANDKTTASGVEESKEDLPEEEILQEASSLPDKDATMADAVEESKEDLPEEEMPQEMSSPAEKGPSMATTADESEQVPPEEEVPDEIPSQSKHARSLEAASANNNDEMADNKNEMADTAIDEATAHPPEEEVPQETSQPVPEKARSSAPTAKKAASTTKPSSQPLAGAEVTRSTATTKTVIEIEDDDDDDDGQGSAALVQTSPRKVDAAQILGSLLGEERDDDQQHDDVFDEMDDETQPLPDSIANTQTAVTALAGLTHFRN
jgi:hypothetical protein